VEGASLNDSVLGAKDSLRSEDELGPDLTAGVRVVDVPDGGVKAGHIGGTKAILVRRGEEIFAIGASCSHLGAPLDQGLLVDHTVRCPWHHACFSLRTGEALCAPAFDPIPRWHVEIDSEIIRVKPEIQAAHTPSKILSNEPFIIVGGGAAGYAAVDMLLRNHFAGEIRWISEEGAAPYDRTLLSKDYLDGHFDEARLAISRRDLSGHENLVRQVGKVTRIDLASRQIVLGDGGVIRYAKLLLATGAEPKRLDLSGSDLPHVKVLRSLQDCREIIALAKQGRNVAVIGGSFIGLEAAASLRDLGCNVSVIAPETQPMARIFGPELANLVAETHRRHGVDWHVGRTVARVTDDSVVLDDSTVIKADLVVVGIGVNPNLGLAKDAGLEVKDGVLVDEYLATSAQDVFAAGDIACWFDRYSGTRIRVEHWVVAERQGQVAALNMMGRAERYTSVPFFWTKHFDLSIRYVGNAKRWDSLSVEGDLSKSDGIVRFEKKGQLLAIATVGRDLASLEEERVWEITGGLRGATFGRP
jgi:NADPH-dependent 2,4-dienoyl-CoA reductase/sulfur reductase-like enzyme/nitrite reductase/ring-hydroxylating ferredoxin subunit